MNRFIITVTYDAATQPVSPLLYENNVDHMTYSLLSVTPSGEIVSRIDRRYDFAANYPSSLTFREEQQRITWAGQGYWYHPRIIFSGNGDALFKLSSQSPIIFDDPSAIFVTFRQNLRQNFFYFFNGQADAIRIFRVDADGDGIKENDACEFSNLDEWVTVNDHTTGVSNKLDNQGCTLMDHFQACQPTPSEDDFILFQPTYSGSSYCEQQVVYGAYRAGVIDYTEVRMLRLAL
ncbi:hypothetical protein [Pseudidiomarina sediminum]|uniref:hypothetical protein n=1 Tax=Pseudidiomarina sediminum TaxID=431675 RepID=UPI001C94526F|nr:hypothetical protein [Pseudidiomarina sediminum]MBY6063666.1 hypothetical protein [Pseudidiomarina sediminum]